jgi:hypothetical protein
MMKVIVVFKRLLASGNDQHGRHIFIQMGVTAGIFLASILLKEMALSSVYKISMFSIAYLMKEYGLQRAGTA